MGFFDDFNADIEDLPELASGPSVGNHEAIIVKAEIRKDVYKRYEKGEIAPGLPEPRFYCFDIKDVEQTWRFAKTMAFELPDSPAPWAKEGVYTVLNNGTTLTEFETNGGRLSRLKAFLEDCGVAPEDMNSITPEALVGLTGVVTLTLNKGKYINATKFKVVAENNAGDVALPKPVSAGTFNEDLPKAVTNMTKW